MTDAAKAVRAVLDDLDWMFTEEHTADFIKLLAQRGYEIVKTDPERFRGDD